MSKIPGGTIKYRKEEREMKDKSDIKTMCINLVSLFLEIICTWLLFNSVIVSIFNVKDISLLQAFGLVFVASWVKFNPDKVKDTDTITERSFTRFISYIFYVVVALIIYLVRRYCFM